MDYKEQIISILEQIEDEILLRRIYLMLITMTKGQP